MSEKAGSGSRDDGLSGPGEDRSEPPETSGFSWKQKGFILDVSRADRSPRSRNSVRLGYFDFRAGGANPVDFSLPGKSGGFSALHDGPISAPVSVSFPTLFGDDNGILQFDEAHFWVLEVRFDGENHTEFDGTVLIEPGVRD